MIAALREYNGEQAKARETALQQAEAANKAADAELKTAIAKRQVLAAELEARRAVSSAAGGDDMAASVARTAQAPFERRMRDNEREIVRLQKLAQDAGASLAEQRAEISPIPSRR